MVVADDTDWLALLDGAPMNGRAEDGLAHDPLMLRVIGRTDFKRSDLLRKVIRLRVLGVSWMQRNTAHLGCK